MLNPAFERAELAAVTPRAEGREVITASRAFDPHERVEVHHRWARDLHDSRRVGFERVDAFELFGEPGAQRSVLVGEDAMYSVEEEVPVDACDFAVVGSFAAGRYAVLSG